MLLYVMITQILYGVILVCGVLFGLCLQKICHDEIVQWKHRFLFLGLMSIIGSIYFSFSPFVYSFPITLSLIFMGILFLTLLWTDVKR
jgi:dolichyl-phosphate-mannose--protein O-mannosyl transferase